MRRWVFKGDLLALVLGLISALKISANAAWTKTLPSGSHKVATNEPTAGTFGNLYWVRDAHANLN
jgi:hypothetical protein